MELRQSARRRFRAGKKEPAHSGGPPRFAWRRKTFARAKNKETLNNLDHVEEKRDPRASLCYFEFTFRSEVSFHTAALRLPRRVYLLTARSDRRLKVERLVRVLLER
jgi:hypothetical protein